MIDAMSKHDKMRKVVMLIYPEVQVLDVTGPVEVFNVATRLLAAEGRQGGYAKELIGPESGSVRSSGGIRLVADRSTLG